MRDENSVLKPEWLLPLSRRVILFQSLHQLLSWALIVVATFLLVQMFFEFAGGPEVPALVLLLAIACGALQSLVFALPGAMTVSSIADSRIQMGIEGCGYVLWQEDASAAVYRQKLPAWLRWDESNVIVKKSGADISIQGPYYLLKRIGRQLS
ncbi:hypothetical protein [Roseateles sp. LYH14W]|uniref:PH domain-containing protein n=1 Tax=Pelomonas parva TaxID=3299032 RepID=A0ABW7EZ30_9BURK